MLLTKWPCGLEWPTSKSEKSGWFGCQIFSLMIGGQLLVVTPPHRALLDRTMYFRLFTAVPCSSLQDDLSQTINIIDKLELTRHSCHNDNWSAVWHWRTIRRDQRTYALSQSNLSGTQTFFASAKRPARSHPGRQYISSVPRKSSAGHQVQWMVQLLLMWIIPHFPCLRAIHFTGMQKSVANSVCCPTKRVCELHALLVSQICMH